MSYTDPNFDKDKYWRNRKAGMRGQATDQQYQAEMDRRKQLKKMQGSK